jgi:hypothetical protein
LIRDLRQHFAAKFDNYLVSKVGKTNTFGKNNRSKYEIFPFLLLRFSIDTFDKELVEGIKTEKSYPDFMKSFALTLGSFILPKFTIRSFGTQDGQESKNIVFRDSLKDTFFVTKQNSPFMRSFEKSVAKGVASMRRVPHAEATFQGTDVNECLLYDITTDFFGVLKDMDLKDKKMYVLTIYRLLFRFSIQTLIGQLNNNEFLLIVLQYLKDTQMTSVHKRLVLSKNQSAYYRVMENFINHSPYKSNLT